MLKKMEEYSFANSELQVSPMQRKEMWALWDIPFWSWILEDILEVPAMTFNNINFSEESSVSQFKKD